MARAMGIVVVGWNGRRVRLRAPFEPNRNDKGTAFAGSLYSILVLAGWAVVTRHLQERGIQADVMVTESSTHYLRPVRAALEAEAELAAVPDPETAFRDFSACGKAQMAAIAWVGAPDAPFADFRGVFALRPRPASGRGQQQQPVQA
jgi:thioesterase domain-containing protein